MAGLRVRNRNDEKSKLDALKAKKVAAAKVEKAKQVAKVKSDKAKAVKIAKAKAKKKGKTA